MTAPTVRIDPVRRATLGAMVTDRLRDHVVHGDFEPGTILSEVELASRFGVSRGPVREALQRLVQEGLLRREARRGVSVPIIEEPDLADLYLAREAIEGAAARVVIADDPAALATALASTVERMRAAAAAGDWATVADLDIAFHADLVAAAGSQRLSRLYGGILDETRAFLAMTARYPGRDDLVAEHEELADLLGRADIDGVLTALNRHLTDSIRTLTVHRRTAASAVPPAGARGGGHR